MSKLLDMLKTSAMADKAKALLTLELLVAPRWKKYGMITMLPV